MKKKKHPPKTGKKRPEEQPLVSLEGRNVVLEALGAGREIEEVFLDGGAEAAGKVRSIMELARKRGVTLTALDRRELDARSQTGSHQGVIALARPREDTSLKTLLETVDNTTDPVILVLGEVLYEQNLGAILRTCDGAGARGVVVPPRRSAPLSSVASRVSMGASEYIPVIRESPTSALAQLSRAGFHIIGVEADGECSHFEADLTGPAALVFGGEDKGLSETLRGKCDRVVSIPLLGRITSLNISVAVAVVLYEKVRQQHVAASD